MWRVESSHHYACISRECKVESGELKVESGKWRV
jgi:hypothetical protein